jgi:biopolymer transport protein ExbD
MRRFSQRSALVTLSEINITPLLDLAFVLLIIFVITTPLLEQSLPLKLYKGGGPSPRVNQRDVHTVEISPDGKYRLDRVPLKLLQVEEVLVRESRANTNMVVFIRADENGRTKDFLAVVDFCRRHGITRVDFRTEPPKRQ